MIILDTNVIREPTAKTPNEFVIAWLDAQAIETLYLSAVTVSELRCGIAAMPPGRRRDEYHTWLEDDTLPTFTGRVLAYDLDTTAPYTHLMSRARAPGRPITARTTWRRVLLADNGSSVPDAASDPTCSDRIRSPLTLVGSGFGGE